MEVYDPKQATAFMRVVIKAKCFYCGKEVELKETLQEYENLRENGSEITSKNGKLVGCSSKWFCSNKCLKAWEERVGLREKQFKKRGVK